MCNCNNNRFTNVPVNNPDTALLISNIRRISQSRTIVRHGDFNLSKAIESARRYLAFKRIRMGSTISFDTAEKYLINNITAYLLRLNDNSASRLLIIFDQVMNLHSVYSIDRINGSNNEQFKISSLNNGETKTLAIHGGHNPLPETDCGGLSILDCMECTWGVIASHWWSALACGAEPEYCIGAMILNCLLSRIGRPNSITSFASITSSNSITSFANRLPSRMLF